MIEGLLFVACLAIVYLMFRRWVDRIHLKSLEGLNGSLNQRIATMELRIARLQQIRDLEKDFDASIRAALAVADLLDAEVIE